MMGLNGDPYNGLKLLQGLLPDREQFLGPNHPDTLLTRNNIAVLTGKTGDHHTALKLFEELLPDREQFLGPNHPDTLNTNAWIDHFRPASGP